MQLRNLLLFFILPFFSWAQSPIGNEWINYDQEYVRIGITTDGFYEIDGASLSKIGFVLENKATEMLQVWHLGKEMSIQVTGVVDGVFGASSKILFYAEKNKGELDSLVYRPSSYRMNFNQSLFSDEAAYFLTLGKTPGKRMVSTAYEEASQAASYHKKIHLQLYEKQYSFNNIIGLLPNLQQSYYEEGEGWTGAYMSADSSSTFFIPVKDFQGNTSLKGHLKMQLNGRSEVKHRIAYSINGIEQADTLLIGNFERLVKELEISDVLLQSGELTIKFTPIPLTTDALDWYSVTSFELTYPQKTSDFANNSFMYAEASKNYKASDKVLNITDRWNVRPYELKEGRFSSRETSINYFYKETQKASVLEKVEFKKIEPTRFNYVILTSESLRNGSTEYANYRESNAGGSYKTLIITPSELYNQFMYGVRNPLAIRRFAQTLLMDDSETKFLFLVGRPVTFPDIMKTERVKDLVPSFGYPGSDVLLTAETKAGFSEVQGMATGRLNVTKNEEILAYLDKIKETEAAPRGQDWKKRFLHLSGGKTPYEISSLASVLDNIKSQATNHFWGASISSTRKQSLEEVELIDISKEVNEGVGLITFAGHGSANVIDLNIGYCSVVENGFKNKGKYPLMFFNGCGVGNVFYRYDPLTTDWLLTPNKGAIAVFANSFWSYLLPTQIYLNRLYEKLFVEKETLGLTLGEIHQEVNKDLNLLRNNGHILANMHQMILQGDPAIKMFPMEAADFEANKEGMYLQSTDLSKPINQNDSLWLYVPINNLGLFDSTQNVKVRAMVNNVEVSNFSLRSFPFRNSVKLKIPGNQNLSEVALSLNPGKEINELTFDNNTAKLSFNNWAEEGSSTSYPANLVPDNVEPLLSVRINGKQIENGDYISAESTIEARVIDENAFDLTNTGLVKMYISSDNNGYELLSLTETSLSKANELLAKAILNLSSGTYILKVEAQDTKGNAVKQPYNISFKVAEGTMKSTISVYPNPVSFSRESQLSFQIIAKENPLPAKIYIYNTKGQLIYDKWINPTVGQNTEFLDLSSYALGVYNVRLEVNWPDRIEVLSTRIVVP